MKNATSLEHIEIFRVIVDWGSTNKDIDDDDDNEMFGALIVSNRATTTMFNKLVEMYYKFNLHAVANTLHKAKRHDAVGREKRNGPCEQ